MERKAEAEAAAASKQLVSVRFDGEWPYASGVMRGRTLLPRLKMY